MITFLSVILRMINVSYRSRRKNQNTYLMISNFFFRKSRTFDVIKNIVEPTGHIEKYGACTLHVGYLRLQIQILRIRNIYCFPSITMVARKRLNVTLCVHCLSCYFFLHSV